jgi:hypothetical protein
MGVLSQQFSASDTGKTARFRGINQLTGQWWNQALNAGTGGFEDYNASNYTASGYLIPMTEVGPAYYRGTIPSAWSGLVIDLAITFDTVVGTPATTDRLAAAGSYYYDGIALQEYSAANIVQVNSSSADATTLANSANSILFDGETAGGSTTTEIWLSDAYDTTKAASYVGNYLVVTGGSILPARISAYTNRGSGASSVTVEAGKFSIAPDPGTNVQIIRAGGPTAAQIVAAGAGNGAFPIDHNGGSGTDAADCTFYIPYSNATGVGSSANVLQFTSNGTTGVEGLLVRAYLASDYDAGTRTVVASTRTLGGDNAGKWQGPLNLDPGTYYIITDAAGDGFAANQVKITVP